MRAIDADALMSHQRKAIMFYWSGEAQENVVTVSEIEKAPTIEAEPVKHGKWIFETTNGREHMKCSNCLKSQTPTGVFAYCPNCGAKMDLE